MPHFINCFSTCTVFGTLAWQLRLRLQLQENRIIHIYRHTLAHTHRILEPQLQRMVAMMTMMTLAIMLSHGLHYEHVMLCNLILGRRGRAPGISSCSWASSFILPVCFSSPFPFCYLFSELLAFSSLFFFVGPKN